MMNTRIRPSMVDIEIQKFSQWKESLEKEDLIECGSVVKRPYKELRRMYASYFKFQTSKEIREARSMLTKEQSNTGFEHKI